MKEPCPGCARPLVSVDIKVEDRTVTMRSCTRCDRRWWVADGAPVDPTTAFAKRTA